jgi:Zn-dependent metalloprotease
MFNDYCYVHGNSTLASHALYGVLGKLGMEKTRTLVYTMVTQFLTPSADFQELRDSTVKACGALKMDAADCESVKTVFAEMGLQERVTPVAPIARKPNRRFPIRI